MSIIFLASLKKRTQNEIWVISADFCVALIFNLVSHFLSTVVSLLTSDNVLVCDRLQNYFECGFEDIC